MPAVGTGSAASAASQAIWVTAPAQMPIAVAPAPFQSPLMRWAARVPWSEASKILPSPRKNDSPVGSLWLTGAPPAYR